MTSPHAHLWGLRIVRLDLGDEVSLISYKRCRCGEVKDVE